ncbi:outer membrane protein OmpW [Shewanella surugensis]|uniref:Outer membrane protein OmpW n=1 Tax=Shewanella surugensis TaxID=212020 RepID=A0ABT0LHC5_9GAMM|nr:outer membrane protein OmpW [Shewanella surugensis]MCL1127103.1 outer membrane protein OmpW [Shewanella surugensis]
MMKKNRLSNAVAVGLFAMGLATSANATQAGDIIVRAGVAVVAPNSSSQDVAGLGEFDVSSDTQLGLNFAYLFTDNIGIELLAASPFSHNISLPTLGNIAKTKELPPTLVVQYHFGDAASKFRPYIGIGINYTNFYDTKFTNDLDGALTDISLSNSWGLAGQVGLDYQLTDKWLLNGSIWYADIDTDASFKLAGESVTIDTNIDPWVYMVSAGYVF